MFKGFKEFLLRGNIVDLAVAVVIGTAFVALVTVFTTSVINPIIASAGGADSDGFGFRILGSNEATFVNIGAFITAVITFAITAAVVENTVLLREIRDALTTQRGSTPSPPAV